MLSLEELEYLADRKNDATNLADIRSIKFDMNESAKERLNNYVAQIKNPYHFKCGDISIKLTYAEDGQNLDKLLKDYFVRHES